MSDVHVPAGNITETATLLLAAAAELELEPSVVRYYPGDAAFVVPAEVARKAKAETVDPDAEANAAIEAAAKDADRGVELAAAENAERVAAEANPDEGKPGPGADLQVAVAAGPEAGVHEVTKTAAKRPARKTAAKKAAPAKKAAAKKSTTKAGA